MARKSMLLLLFAVTLLAYAASPAAARGPHDFFGIVQGAPFTSKDYAKLGKSGTGTIRFGLQWYAVQPTRSGGFNWSAIDAKVGELAARGIRSFPTISGSPSWVENRAKRPPVDSAQAKDAWRKFLSAAVKRYGRSGTYWNTAYPIQHPGKRKLPIKEWQIWNEPNLPKFFPKKHAAHNYAELVKISDGPIHSADRRAKVVLAGMPAFIRPTADRFLGRLYRTNGFKRSFDAAALHPYAENIKEFVTSIKRLRGTLKRHHDKGKGLWLTEVGWGSMRHHGHLNVGKQGQKRLLKRSFSTSLHHRRRWNLDGVQWFDWRDPPAGNDTDCSFCGSSGLLKHNYAKKPAYRAYRHFAKRN